MASEFWTPSGVRLREYARRGGDLNWLFLPGGPGLGSESLHELADNLDVPGAIWMVDLPGDGSNTAAPGASQNPYEGWPDVLIEAAQALPNVVYAGHSTGGMYLLSVPELERHIVGLVLISTAPDAGWRSDFEEMVRTNPLPAVDAATQCFEADRTNENLRDVAVASAEWNFARESLMAGRKLLGRMPYNVAAMDWSAEAFDDIYGMKWWPASTPTLILSGAWDRIVTQRLWDTPLFHGPNVRRCIVEGGAHFPWMEQPGEVREAFSDFAATIDKRSKE